MTPQNYTIIPPFYQEATFLDPETEASERNGPCFARWAAVSNMCGWKAVFRSARARTRRPSPKMGSPSAKNRVSHCQTSSVRGHGKAVCFTQYEQTGQAVLPSIRGVRGEHEQGKQYSRLCQGQPSR